MVELPAASVQGVEIGQELAVREQVAEWPAMGLLPGKHAGEKATLVRPSHVAAGVADWVFATLVPVGVESVVERFDFALREELADDDEALQVEEEFFGVVHVDSDLPSVVESPTPPQAHVLCRQPLGVRTRHGIGWGQAVFAPPAQEGVGAVLLG